MKPDEARKRMNDANESTYLEILSALHYSNCAKEIQTVIMQVLDDSSNQKYVMPTLRLILQHWPVTNAIKEAAFLTLTSAVLSKLNAREFRGIMKDIFNLYGRSSISPNLKVVHAAYSIWNQINLEPYIMDNSRVLFPIIYSYISQGMREHWSSDANDVLSQILSSMNRIDSIVTQELCRGKTLPPQTDEQTKIRSWAQIARQAQRVDRNINLATKLAEIQRTFGKTVNNMASPSTRSISQYK